MAAPASAEFLRLATYAPALSRDGPGLLLREIRRGKAQIATAACVIVNTAPDILFLTGFDGDAQGAALAAFVKLLREAGGPDYPYLLAALEYRTKLQNRPRRRWPP